MEFLHRVSEPARLDEGLVLGLGCAQLIAIRPAFMCMAGEGARARRGPEGGKYHALTAVSASSRDSLD
ncbi:MAG TPA: hypothetical protein PL143_03350 [Rhodocyclaceae bacterium]|nr:hypothetical protein [Rhodocyclaceae bacterium]